MAIEKAAARGTSAIAAVVRAGHRRSATSAPIHVNVSGMNSMTFVAQSEFRIAAYCGHGRLRKRSIASASGIRRYCKGTNEP